MARRNTPDGFIEGGVFASKNSPAKFDVTIGTEAADVINVSIQAKSADDDNVSAITSFLGYLSSNADGSGLTVTAPSGGVVAGSEGFIISEVTGKAFTFVTNTSGAADIDITEAAAATWYLVLFDALGRSFVSNAITFAA